MSRPTTKGIQVWFHTVLVQTSSSTRLHCICTISCRRATRNWIVAVMSDRLNGSSQFADIPSVYLVIEVTNPSSSTYGRWVCTCAAVYRRRDRDQGPIRDRNSSCRLPCGRCHRDPNRVCILFCLCRRFTVSQPTPEHDYIQSPLFGH